MDNPTQWSEADAVALRNNQQLARIIEALRQRKPKSEGLTIESAALNSKLRDGYDLAIDTLIGLQVFASSGSDGAGFIE